MSLRDLATKLREQAREAAQIVKHLPTFDDMAARDDYIHSDEYNVRGKPSASAKASRNMTEEGRGETRHLDLGIRDQIVPAGREGTTTANTTTTSTVADEASLCSTESSSWSLLDRPRVDGGGIGVSLSSSSSVTRRDGKSVSDQTEMTQSDSSHQHRKQPPVKPSNTITTNKSRSNSPMPMLLSVVADALQDSPRGLKAESTKTAPTRSRLPPLLPSTHDSSTASRNSKASSLCTSDEDYGDDHCLDDEFQDEDDPIMSMIRKDNPTPRPTTERPNRFMEDLDRRLKTPSPHEDIEAALLPDVKSSTLSHQLQQEPTTTKTSVFTPGHFGGYFRNLAMTQVNRILNRPQSPTPSCTTASSRAPLARDRAKKRKPENTPEEDFHVLVSSSVFAREDLAELEQLKRQASVGIISGSHGQILMVMVESLQENRHFLFIAFTLLLALFLYFYKDKVILT